jgi:hypothetical protein
VVLLPNMAAQREWPNAPMMSMSMDCSFTVLAMMLASRESAMQSHQPAVSKVVRPSCCLGASWLSCQTSAG